MGLRIEFILSIGIALIVGMSYMIKLNNNVDTNVIFTKELEFIDTTFIEVSTIQLNGHIHADNGVRDKGILTLNNIKYKTKTIESLVAKKGTYKGNTLYLEGNVLMYDNDGYTYETQQAEYNQQTEILNITAPFVASHEKNTVKGDTFTYNTRNKEAYGTRIDAIIYTVEK